MDMNNYVSIIPMKFYNKFIINIFSKMNKLNMKKKILIGKKLNTKQMIQ